ncbi:hypothetical protein [Brevibacterium linens]|uniref:hypothetical protein n=1 Tax=Brevibacterium linens TaxID=1703 RepID=UPI003F8C0E1F
MTKAIAGTTMRQPMETFDSGFTRVAGFGEPVGAATAVADSPEADDAAGSGL